MEFTIVEVNPNFGYGKHKMKIISREPLSDYQKRYLASLKRDEVIKYGKLYGWTVLDMED